MAEVRNFTVGFDRGLESVTTRSGAESPRLPDYRDVNPSGALTSQLSQLLDKPDMASFLDAAICPPVADRSLLGPTEFRQVFESALTTLRQEAEARKDTDPESAKTLGRAVRALNDDARLQELLNMYRSALLKG